METHETLYFIYKYVQMQFRNVYASSTTSIFLKITINIDNFIRTWSQNTWYVHDDEKSLDKIIKFLRSFSPIIIKYVFNKYLYYFYYNKQPY